MKKLSVLPICIALVFCVSFSSSAVASDEEEVLEVVENFGKALSTGDYELISSLWWDSNKTTSFNPSGDPFLYEGWTIIGDSWESISEEPLGSRSVTMHNVQGTLLENGIAITTAYANDAYTDPETRETTIGLIRQTLVLQKIDGKWLIVHHHASMLPTQ